MSILQVSAKGMVGSCTDGINTATFSYKRIPDIVVSSYHSGMGSVIVRFAIKTNPISENREH